MTAAEAHRLERARDFAIRAHEGQLYGSEPYVVHLAQVVRTLLHYGHEGDVVVAGWLHDTAEDTKVTLDQIETEFGPDVRTLVWAVTGVGANRKARRQCMYDRIRSLTGETLPLKPEEQRAQRALADKAASLKLADLLSNGRQSAENNQGLFDMYRKEFPTFRQKLGDLGEVRMWNDAGQLFLPQ